MFEGFKANKYIYVSIVKLIGNTFTKDQWPQKIGNE